MEYRLLDILFQTTQPLLQNGRPIGVRRVFLFNLCTVEYFEGYYPVDQLVLQQLRCAPYNLDNLPDYEIHMDQRARIPLGVGNQRLWLTILNEDDLKNLDKQEARKGDLLLEFSPAHQNAS